MSLAAEFMAAAPAPLGGNTPWAARYAAEIRRLVREHAELSPRSLQEHLGPSELGTPCDRQVVAKLAGVPRTNHVVDPWPSIVGVAVHHWLAGAFEGANLRHGQRWLPEQRVYPRADHGGTADLYDSLELAVVDHKILGETSLAKVRSPAGPPTRYQIQLLLYAWGYLVLGIPVKRIALAAYPRTQATLDGLYVWDRELREGDDFLIQEVFRITDERKALAELVKQGQTRIEDVPRVPDDDECYFCPFYRPQSARDNGPGCPGTVEPKARQSTAR